jgi:hypothetical protein
MTARQALPLAAHSDVLDVMWRPVMAYARLARGSETTTLAMLRRPAFLALLIGCCVALSSSGRFTLRLLVSTTFLWSFAPMLQLLAAAVIIRLLGDKRLSLPAGLDLYFVGIGPWSLWLLAVAGVYSFLSPERTVTWGSDLGISVVTTGAIPLAWSAVITFGFLRGALGLNLQRTLLGFVLHGALVWGPVVAWFLFTGHLLPRLAGLLAR